MIKLAIFNWISHYFLQWLNLYAIIYLIHIRTQDITLTKQFSNMLMLNHRRVLLHKRAFINHVDIAGGGEGVCQMSILLHKLH